jgi:hypothetical protein
MKTKLIYTQQIASELAVRGNLVIKTVPNLKVKGMNCYLFEETEKFNEDLAHITGVSKMSYFVVRTQKLAGHLLEKGYSLEKTEPQRENPRFKVFLFRNSKELREEVKSYSEEVRRNKEI